jgi:hypothetical protein
LLLVVFGFVAFDAVVLSKAISLLVVASALAFRSTVVPFFSEWPAAILIVSTVKIGWHR